MTDKNNVAIIYSEFQSDIFLGWYWHLCRKWEWYKISVAH